MTTRIRYRRMRDHSFPQDQGNGAPKDLEKRSLLFE